jgi:hypothetical protein
MENHIMFDGCSEPLVPEIANKSIVFPCYYYSGKQFISGCKGEQKLNYIWQRGDEDLRLPMGTGLSVGGMTGINYLVLAMHYHMNPDSAAMTTAAGFQIEYEVRNDTGSASKVTKIFIVSSRGFIKSDSQTNVEAACPVLSSPGASVEPIAFIVHTHKLGTCVSGWHVSGRTGEWTLIGKHDPRNGMSPHAVSPAIAKLTMTSGDWIAIRCTMNNTHGLDKRIGFAFFAILFHLIY